MLTVKEVATETKMSEPTIRRWLKEEKIKGVKFGPRQWRIPASEIDRIIKEGEDK